MNLIKIKNLCNLGRNLGPTSLVLKTLVQQAYRVGENPDRTLVWGLVPLIKVFVFSHLLTKFLQDTKSDLIVCVCEFVSHLVVYHYLFTTEVHYT